MTPDLTGLDIHRGLRIRWEGNKPAFGRDLCVRIEEDVRDYIRLTRQRLEYAERWLAAWRATSDPARDHRCPVRLEERM